MYCAIPVSFSQATLGADISITALDGKKIDLKIPAGTPSGKLLRIKGEGVPVTGTTRRGDLYVKVMVRIPQKISGAQKDLLVKYMELENPVSNPQMISLNNLEG